LFENKYVGKLLRNIPDVNVFKYLPQNLITEKMCINLKWMNNIPQYILNNNYAYFQNTTLNIPKNYDINHLIYVVNNNNHNECFDKFSQEVIKRAILEFGKIELLKYINKEKLTYNDYLKLVKYNLNFSEIPKQFLTEELYIKAIKYHENLLKEIPLDSLTQKIYDSVINVDILEIPKKFRTKKVWTNYYTKRWNSDCIMPEDEDMFIIYINNQWISYDDYPDKFKTFDMWKFAYKYILADLSEEDRYKIYTNNYDTNSDLNYIQCIIMSRPMVNPDFSSYKVNRYKISLLLEDKYRSFVLKYIPDEYKTKEICEFLVMKCNGHFKYVPKELKTKKMCESIVTEYLFKYIPKKLWTRKVIKNCIKYGNYLAMPKNIRRRMLIYTNYYYELI
jgi:hypothetical protein